MGNGDAKLALRPLEDRLHVLAPHVALFPGPSDIVASPSLSPSSAIPFAIASPIEHLGHAAPLPRSRHTYPNGEDKHSLWNEQDGMYCDAIQWGGHSMQPVRSLVGLIPLYATLTLEPGPEVSGRNTVNMKARGRGEQFLLALASEDRLISILEKMLDESEFFSDTAFDPYRSYTRTAWKDTKSFFVICPGYATNEPVAGLAVNFLFTESLQRFHQYYGDELQIQHRIIHIFGRDINGRRALNGGNQKLDFDPFFRDYVWFYEYDDGRGLGASHQTGWSGLVAYHILQSGASCRLPKTPKTPRSLAHHFFDETLDYQSEHGDDIHSLKSAFSANELNTLSPTAL
ncbi:hypothetical protein EDB84DRAFT_1634459 [Lactarius hengduanensis]|nr:hypothetical protein EDB84DRAFT_1634459 [Lactarius hengduanensis]